jgi:RecJ-like exonuclease
VVLNVEDLFLPDKIMDILKIAISLVIIIVIALFFLTQFNNENTDKINNIKIGQTARVTGMVTSVYVTKNDHVFLKVADNTGEVTVIAFNNSNIDLAYDLQNGDQVSVIGKVDAYKGKLEIIAKEITKV